MMSILDDKSAQQKTDLVVERIEKLARANYPSGVGSSIKTIVKVNRRTGDRSRAERFAQESNATHFIVRKCQRDLTDGSDGKRNLMSAGRLAARTRTRRIAIGKA